MKLLDFLHDNLFPKHARTIEKLKADLTNSSERVAFLRANLQEHKRVIQNFERSSRKVINDERTLQLAMHHVDVHTINFAFASMPVRIDRAADCLTGYKLLRLSLNCGVVCLEENLTKDMSYDVINNLVEFVCKKVRRQLLADVGYAVRGRV